MVTGAYARVGGDYFLANTLFAATCNGSSICLLCSLCSLSRSEAKAGKCSSIDNFLNADS